TANALRPSTAPIVAPVSVSGAISTPATAAVSDDSAYENVITSPVLMPINDAASRSFDVATTALPKIVLRLKNSTASIITNAPATTSSSIGSTFAPSPLIGDSGSGDGKRRSSRPHTFSATFLKMMPSAMVDMIQPNSDLILMAGRTPIRSTNAPCASPNRQTSGIITQ